MTAAENARKTLFDQAVECMSPTVLRECAKSDRACGLGELADFEAARADALVDAQRIERMREEEARSCQ